VPTLLDVRTKIRLYNKKYRHPDNRPLEISKKYDLFPSRKIESSNFIGWPSQYPHADRQGVYLICDKNQQVLYIGKVSFKNTLLNFLIYLIIR